MKPKVHPWNVLLKALILYFLFQFLLVFFDFDPTIFNVYRSKPLIRERFPFITSSTLADKALDVGILDAIFASHVISQPKRENEYRVIILGDSSIWGDPLPTAYTLTSQINALEPICRNKQITTYNLGYPLPSGIKDIMVLDRAMQYQPDLVIWGVTMFTLTTRILEEHPLLGTESEELTILNSKYHFMNGTAQPDSLYKDWVNANFKLSRTLRYQSYSLIQLATHTDQIQEEINLQHDKLTDDPQYLEMLPPILQKKEISTDLVNIFHQIAKDTPVIIINEPILIVKNEANSDLRYNSFYPRWAYDQYRQYMTEAANQYKWTYLDLWDSLPPESFANSPLHLNRNGEKILAGMVLSSIQDKCLK
jgi:hypothetical protein